MLRNNGKIIDFMAIHGLPFPAKSMFITLKMVNNTTPGNKTCITETLSKNCFPQSNNIIGLENNIKKIAIKLTAINESLNK